MSIPEEGRRKVFVSYSHNDRDWLGRLQVHLKPLERAGLVELWDDTKIRPGDEWRKEISGALNSASVAVLLISADFIASDFITNNELPHLLAAAENNGVVVLPLILSPSRFEKTESLARFQSVNPPSKPLITLSRGEQEHYLVKLSDEVVRVVEETQKKPAKAGVTEVQRIFSLPFSRNKYFIGRDDILSCLHTNFGMGESVQALSGMPGIGKTQTALEYAYRYREEYKVVLWGNANSREELDADFIAMAGLLNLSEKTAKEQSEVVGAVNRWLEENDNWLLILDNADDLARVRNFIPTSEAGHVILTTRDDYTGPIAERIPIEKLSPQEGALFLLRRLKKVKKDEQLESTSAELHTQSEILSKTLDGLPLALDQAVAYIGELSLTLKDYLDLYRIKRAELLDTRGNFVDDHPESVVTTFSLAFEALAKVSPPAVELLRLCAFLEADAIPEEIFSTGAGESGELLGPVILSPPSLYYVIRDARRFSLLHRNPETKTVSLHRLVQAVLRDEMDESTERIWAERAVRAVSSVFPGVEYVNWPLCSRLVPHVQSLAGIIDEFGFEFPEAARMMNQAGHYLNERAQYAEAEPLYQRALGINEKALGSEHPFVATSLNNLAGLYKDQGKYTEAEQLFQRALIIREKALGAEHPFVATSLNNLAVLYESQGKYAEALPLCHRALAIKEKALGSEHPDVAMVLDNLALLYKNLWEYTEAESLCKRALAIREESLGPEHPDVATSLNSLAVLYYGQGKYSEAQPLFQRALAIHEKAQGPEHPDVATTIDKLAEFSYNQGKYLEAEPLFQRALAIREKVFGDKHPDVATSLNNIALLYSKQGKYAEAEPLYERALAIREKALGEEHPAVATSLASLALLYDRQGKYTEAESLYIRALAIYEKVLGDEHPDVALILDNLALLYQDQGKYVEAEPLFQRALAINEKALGSEDPDVAIDLENYASLLRATNRESEAETLEARALAIRKKHLSN